MIVEWSKFASEQLISIYEYIAKDSPLYATRMVDRITRKSLNIATLPDAGQLVPEFESSAIREVIEYPYRIIYRRTEDRVVVLAVIHGAMQLPNELSMES